jgi:predicted nucleic acid-binding protein
MKLLDTCVVSAFLKTGRTTSPKLREFVSALLGGEGFAIAFVTQWELRRGIEELVRRGEGRRKRELAGGATRPDRLGARGGHGRAS